MYYFNINNWIDMNFFLLKSENIFSFNWVRIGLKGIYHNSQQTEIYILQQF